MTFESYLGFDPLFDPFPYDWYVPVSILPDGYFDYLMNADFVVIQGRLFNLLRENERREAITA